VKECKVPFGDNVSDSLEKAGFNPDLPYNSFQSKNGEYTVYQQKEGDEWIEYLFYRISELEDRLQLLE
jgi:hypothetical protein